MDTNKILELLKSKKVAVLIAVLFCLAILVGTFSMGVAVGYRKAKFSYAWGENYHRNFGGPRGGFLKDLSKDLMGEDFIGAYGAFGEIIGLTKVGLDNSVIVKGRDDVEKIVITTKDTVVKKGSETMQDYLKIGDRVVIIGEPNDSGQIVAKFIRVMPFPSPTRLDPAERVIRR